MKENWNILKWLIDVVIFLGKHDVVHDESVEFRELLELLAKYDPIIGNYLKT